MHVLRRMSSLPSKPIDRMVAAGVITLPDKTKIAVSGITICAIHKGGLHGADGENIPVTPTIRKSAAQGEIPTRARRTSSLMARDYFMIKAGRERRCGNVFVTANETVSSLVTRAWKGQR